MFKPVSRARTSPYFDSGHQNPHTKTPNYNYNDILLFHTFNN